MAEEARPRHMKAHENMSLFPGRRTWRWFPVLAHWPQFPHLNEEDRTPLVPRLRHQILVWSPEDSDGRRKRSLTSWASVQAARGIWGWEREAKVWHKLRHH